jgi:very-short-patch-repair endonuclease
VISGVEETPTLMLKAHGLPRPVREYRFHPSRKWRFDFAWPDVLLAVEVEGGGFSRGRHHRAAGFAADCEKYNAAALLGWRVLRFTPAMVEDGSAVEPIKHALGFSPAAQGPGGGALMR